MRPLIRPSSSRERSTHVAAPSVFEPVERGLDRLSGGAPLPGTPERCAERELRAGLSERVAERLVPRDRFFQERHRFGDGPACRRDEAAAARHGCEDVVVADSGRVAFPPLEHRRRLVASVELEQRLDELRRPGARVCRAPPERASLAVRPGKTLDGRRRIAPPERDDSRHGLEQGRVEPDLLLAQLQRVLRLPLRTIEVASVRGDPRDRDVA